MLPPPHVNSWHEPASVGRVPTIKLRAVEGQQVVTVRGEEELAARAGHLFAHVKSEFSCAAADTSTWAGPRTRAAVADRLGSAFPEGLVVRKLYSPRALVEDEQRRHLLDVAAAGVDVRICTTTLPHETIVIDRRLMILAGPRIHGDREFTVTTSPTLIDGVYTWFRAAWEAAIGLHAYLRQDLPPVDSTDKVILRALGDGLTDEVAARRTGLSLRTYRRRVAGLMKLLEAQSRFQAGVRVGEAGLAR